MNSVRECVGARALFTVHCLFASVCVRVCRCLRVLIWKSTRAVWRMDFHFRLHLKGPRVYVFFVASSLSGGVESRVQQDVSDQRGDHHGAQSFPSTKVEETSASQGKRSQHG